MTLFESYVQEHLERGCSLPVARAAARKRLEEAGLWDALLHPRARAGEFAEKGGGSRPELRTRSGRVIRRRPYETNREDYLHGLAKSKPAKFSRSQIQNLKHIKNVLKDDKVPTNVKLELAGGAMGLILGTAIPLIPGDEIISAGVISHALKRARGESLTPLTTRVGQVTQAVGGTGMMRPATDALSRSIRPTVHMHDVHGPGPRGMLPRKQQAMSQRLRVA